MPELTPALAWELATGGPWPAPEQLAGDERFMAEALREGLKGVGLSSPNPPVGCTGFTPSGAATASAFSGAGALWVFVGATVTPAAAQPAGNYSGTVTLMAAYF